MKLVKAGERGNETHKEQDRVPREGRVVYGHSVSDMVSQRARSTVQRDRECFAPAQSANISRCETVTQTTRDQAHLSASRKIGAR
eukprot:scaffold9965_cov64-Phaeocystis_antarctica.AAC.3